MEVLEIASVVGCLRMQGTDCFHPDLFQSYIPMYFQVTYIYSTGIYLNSLHTVLLPFCFLPGYSDSHNSKCSVQSYWHGQNEKRIQRNPLRKIFLTRFLHPFLKTYRKDNGRSNSGCVSIFEDTSKKYFLCLPFTNISGHVYIASSYAREHIP